MKLEEHIIRTAGKLECLRSPVLFISRHKWKRQIEVQSKRISFYHLPRARRRTCICTYRCTRAPLITGISRPRARTMAPPSPPSIFRCSLSFEARNCIARPIRSRIVSFRYAPVIRHSESPEERMRLELHVTCIRCSLPTWQRCRSRS